MKEIKELLQKMSTTECFYVIKDNNGHIIDSFMDISGMKQTEDTYYTPDNKKAYNVVRREFKSIIVETWTDITELVALREQATKNEKHIAELEKDDLTGLLTRRKMIRGLCDLVGNAIIQRDKLVIVMCDIDKFKDVNDNYGHNSGDDVLKTFGQLLISNATAYGFLASRYAGDEFLLVYPNQELKDVLISLNIIKDQLNGLIFMANNSDTTFKVTASFGAHELLSSTMGYNNSSDLITSLIDQADKAMYYSKSKGRNNISYYHLEKQTFEIFDTSMDKSM